MKADTFEGYDKVTHGDRRYQKNVKQLHSP